MTRPAIHPGEILKEELEDANMSAAELARNLGVPHNRFTEIIRGSRSITGDTALRLAHWFGTAPQFWLNLQAQYDLRIAEHNIGDALQSLPVRPRTQPNAL